MDAAEHFAELERIAVTLKSAIAEVRLLLAAGDPAVMPDVRDIIRHAREMHDLLEDALLRSRPLATAYYSWIFNSTGLAVDDLEALVTHTDGNAN